jgi:hypothetical protein
MNKKEVNKMDNLTDLKLTLQQIKEDNYAISTDYKTTDLIFEMLNHIGNPDPILRDELINSILSQWIINHQITENDLKKVLDTVINDDHLFYKIGESNTNSVFTRSFSVLIVALVVYSHRKQNLFNEEEIINISKKVTSYFLQETDLRGYVEGNGWAHSVAHTADAIDELAMCNEIGYKELLYFLEIIQIKVCVGNYVYINKEDERLVTAVISILNRNLISSEEVCRWIKSYSQIKGSGNYMNDYYMRINVKNFLRSFYFRILDKEELKEISERLRETLIELS